MAASLFALATVVFTCLTTPESAVRGLPEPQNAGEPSDHVAKQVLLLRAEEPDMRVEGADGGILIREIVRQAVLIAARDGLGIATRDLVLREFLPENAKAVLVPLDIKSTALIGKHVLVSVTRGAGKDRQVIGEIQVPLEAGDSIAYQQLIVAAEKMSRTDFVQMLKQAG